MLDALMSGIAVMANCGTNASEFVGSDTCADTAAADQNATIGAAIQNGMADSCGEIGIVRWVFVERTNVKNAMAESANHVAHGVLQLKACVVRTDYDFHRGLTFPEGIWPR